MSAREEVADHWDDLLARWVSGDRAIPAELAPWFDSYSGRDAGVVTGDAFGSIGSIGSIGLSARSV